VVLSKAILSPEDGIKGIVSGAVRDCAGISQNLGLVSAANPGQLPTPSNVAMAKTTDLSDTGFDGNFQ